MTNYDTRFVVICEFCIKVQFDIALINVPSELFPHIRQRIDVDFPVVIVQRNEHLVPHSTIQVVYDLLKFLNIRCEVSLRSHVKT